MTARVAAPSLETGDAGDDRLAERILAAALWLAAAGVASQTLVDVVVVWGLDRRYEVLLADSDESVFAWASVAVTFTASVGAFLLSLVAAERRRLWFAAAAMAFLSLDDFVRIHERLGDLSDSAESLAAWEPGRLLWPVLFLPLLAGLVLALWSVAGRLPGPHRRFVAIGIALLAAAVLLEIASAGILRAGYDRGTVPYELEVIAEEGAELAGWMLIAGALLSAFALDARRGAATMAREGG